MIVKAAAASLLVLAWASGAAAQTAPAPDANGVKPVSEVAEVVVTAQRRSQHLEEVPISVAVATSADLERAGGATIENLTKVTPGIYMQKAVYGLSPTVRGVGSTLPASGGEQNVAIYVDNIYYASPTGNVFDLASVSGIEVLKGPQGTLFGRNATGGAILIHTLDPTFSYAGKFNVSYARFNEVRTSGYLNIPLGDKVAVNGSIAYRSSDGFQRDLKTGALTGEGTSLTSRVKVLLQPTDNFTVILTGAHARFDDPTGDDFQNLRPAAYVTLLGGPVSKDPDRTSQATHNVIKTGTDELSARAMYELEWGTFNSYTAYLRNSMDALNDLDGGYLGANVALSVRSKVFTQELNFASSKDGPLAYVAGLYYYNSKQAVPTLTQNGAPLFNSASQVSSVAAYVDGTYTIGRLSLIGGLRYSTEWRHAQFAPGVNAPSAWTRQQGAKESAFTPRVGLQYAVGERTNLYATYSKGFKAGVFDGTSQTGPSVEPEKVNAFEVGFKSASPAFSYNLAAFYYDYQDAQVNSTVSDAAGNIHTQLFNVPKARIYGVEGDVSFRLSDDFDLRGAVAYTHARYIDFKTAPGYTNDPANPATLGGLLYTSVPVNASGKTMVRSPDLTASATIDFHRQLTSNNRLNVTLSSYYSSRVYFTFFNDLSQPAYVTLDGNVSLTLTADVKVSVFGHNLTDERYKVGEGQNALSNETAIFSAPRSYGVALAVAF